MTAADLATEPIAPTAVGAEGIGTLTLEIDLPAACSSWESADWARTEAGLIRIKHRIRIKNLKIFICLVL